MSRSVVGSSLRGEQQVHAPAGALFVEDEVAAHELVLASAEGEIALDHVEPAVDAPLVAAALDGEAALGEEVHRVLQEVHLVGDAHVYVEPGLGALLLLLRERVFRFGVERLEWHGQLAGDHALLQVDDVALVHHLWLVGAREAVGDGEVKRVDGDVDGLDRLIQRTARADVGGQRGPRRVGGAHPIRAEHQPVAR